MIFKTSNNNTRTSMSGLTEPTRFPTLFMFALITNQKRAKAVTPAASWMMRRAYRGKCKSLCHSCASQLSLRVVISLFLPRATPATLRILLLGRYPTLENCRLPNRFGGVWVRCSQFLLGSVSPFIVFERSEEHTSELQSRQYLVCR